MGGLKQLRAKLADRALARGVHGGPGDWPLGGCKEAAPPCLKKIVFCELNMRNLLISGPF